MFEMIPGWALGNGDAAVADVEARRRVVQGGAAQAGRRRPHRAHHPGLRRAPRRARRELGRRAGRHAAQGRPLHARAGERENLLHFLKPVKNLTNARCSVFL